MKVYFSNPSIDISSLSGPTFNLTLDQLFVSKGRDRQPPVFDDDADVSAKMDFLKNRVGIEGGFGHASFLGIDLLKFQVASYSGLDKIDVGVYVSTTKNFHKVMKKEFNQNWEGSLSFEKIVRYLPHFKSAIQVPIYVLGIDL
ncbi:BglII/BstYI family type II restriction endonuclease [Brevibacillus parabrevis]|uniref:BglII/BstYI family type II restriction endonuclease n=1 Tax=Brevibacillus parabrevis TaxID=54914 RepID=UPI002FC32A21